MSLDDRVGSLRPGREADFVVWDWSATRLLARRVKAARTLEERLFALAMLGDDRAAAAVYSNGELRHERAAPGL